MYQQLQSWPTPELFVKTTGGIPPVDTVLILATGESGQFSFFYVNGDSDTILSFPNLNNSQSITISDSSGNGDVVSVLFGSQLTMNAYLNVTCPNMVTLQFQPGLVINNGCLISSNLLTTFVTTGMIFADFNSIDFSSCISLDAATVNGILASCVASSLANSAISIGGAAPTGQGIIDKATLIAAGNSVTTN